MPESQGRTPEASQITAAIEDPRMEKGRNQNRFHSQIARTQVGCDSIWVIMDRLAKVAHFIPVKTTYSGAMLTKLYMSRIVCLHGVPKKIVSDRGSQFTSKFWEKLHESMDTKLNFSLAYHPPTDGQTERTNQTLEDTL
jgi:transposase InsO family protein